MWDRAAPNVRGVVRNLDGEEDPRNKGNVAPSKRTNESDANTMGGWQHKKAKMPHASLYTKSKRAPPQPKPARLSEEMQRRWITQS